MTTEPESIYLDGNPKSAAGAVKPQFHLIPLAPLAYLARVFEHGAAKYGPFNWRETGVKASVYISAILRHLFAWTEGEDLDPDSGKPHLAHVMASCCILLDAYLSGKLIDDRPKANNYKVAAV
jgi:hypothetical protein